MVKIGLTGGIGSGKTAVGRLLVEHGAVLVDADVLAREVVAPGTDGLRQVVAEFGDEVLSPDGTLDRARLAALVFADSAALARLNAIVHPLVGRRSAEIVGGLPEQAIVVHDVPLLVENSLAPAYDLVVVVEAPEEVRVARLVGQRGLTEVDARARIAAQATDEQRRAVADVVVVNDGSLAALEATVDGVWRDRIAPLAAGRD